ncbi:MAG: hypothetical protein R3F61_10405 [Myxococcota bacterium]
MYWLIASALAAPCDSSILGPALTQVENGYLNGDSAQVSAGIRTAKKHIHCDDVTPQLAARYHRANALGKALGNDWSGAELHLRASLAASPLATPLFKDADPRITLAWQRAQETPIAWSASKPGMVNGLEMALRPDVPYLGSGKSGSAGPAVRWAAIGGAVVAAGMYGGALVSRGNYEKVRGGTAEEVRPAYNTTNGLFFASVGTAALSAGLFAVSFTL